MGRLRIFGWLVHDRDHLGRPLPVWPGCRVVATGDVFLLNTRAKDSLDSRYFGTPSDSTIVGQVVPLKAPDHSKRHASPLAHYP
jgi:type IV secretory pathway protease TraF